MDQGIKWETDYKEICKFSAEDTFQSFLFRDETKWFFAPLAVTHL